MVSLTLIPCASLQGPLRGPSAPLSLHRPGARPMAGIQSSPVANLGRAKARRRAVVGENASLPPPRFLSLSLPFGSPLSLQP